ncbi:hypothetical protein GMORB2_4746 [Geosmithia morbida]|uniref:Protein HRI1 n=1 Tax=Geosmithia morbida TaxID=1094350 RepID=A0A9P4YM31_9HYPO|nr:uncharacterized protein GMORB2_4746 [Geosmithia morbida]KAF4119481.1 hypothetical protein GMORB2_4746 [Geosmithia morbida]
MPSQAVQRISLRWLPDPAFEDSDTVALNVGGYFVDLRVSKKDQTIQWSRAGERIPLKTKPPTFRWTHIIDSLDLTVPDDAHFEKLPNGDDLEIGTTPAPHLENIPTDYEEVWRDITAKKNPNELSWILQSEDGTAFVARVGNIYLAIRKASGEALAARRQDRKSVDGKDVWNVTFESGDTATLPQAVDASLVIEASGRFSEGQKVKIGPTNYISRAVSID